MITTELKHQLQGTIFYFNGTTIDYNGTSFEFNGTNIDINDTNIDFNGTRFDFNGTNVDYNGTNTDFNGTNLEYLQYLQSVQIYIYVILIPILLICGTAGHIISWVVYVRKWSPFTVPLLFLSCTDMLFLWSESIFAAHWAYLGESLEATAAGCKLSYYILQATFFASTYTITFFTIMRAYSVVRPQHFRSIFKTKRSIYITCLLVASAFVLESRALISLDIVNGTDGTKILYRAMVCDFVSVNSTIEFYMRIWILVEEVVAVACVGTILIGNGMIIISLVRHSHDNAQSGINTPEVSRRLIAISAVYLLTRGPSTAFTLFGYGGVNRETGSSEDWWMMLMMDFSVIPLLIQSALGFIIYVMPGKEFRTEVIHLFFPRCK